MTVTVRATRVDDAGVIAAVHVRSWRHAYAGLVPQSLLDGLSVEEGAERWTRRLENVDSETRRAVAEVDGTVVGFAVVGPGELIAIYLDPEHWGHGVGHRLHEWAMAELAAMHTTTAVLWVLSTNLRAREFYERHGWRADGVDKDIDKNGVTLHATRYSQEVSSGQGTTTSLPRV